jgi:hypothetical protein
MHAEEIKEEQTKRVTVYKEDLPLFASTGKEAERTLTICIFEARKTVFFTSFRSNVNH